MIGRQTVYKVIKTLLHEPRADGSVIVGCSMTPQLSGVVKVRYGIGFKTVPVVGYLFAFSNPDDAYNALLPGVVPLGIYEMWSADAVVVDDRPVAALVHIGNHVHIKEFWKVYSDPLASDKWPTFHVPHGTVLCSEITLKERVL